MLNSLLKGVNLKNYGSCKHVKNVIGNGGEVKQLEGVRVEIDKEPWLKKIIVYSHCIHFLIKGSFFLIPRR